MTEKSRNTIPWIGDIPYLGDFLSSYTTEKITTEVILVITPHLMRSVTPTDLAKQTIWSGTAKKFATEPLFSKKTAPMALVSNQGVPAGPNGDTRGGPEPSSPSSPGASSQKPQAPSATNGQASKDKPPQAQGAAHLTLLPAAITKKSGRGNSSKSERTRHPFD